MSHYDIIRVLERQKRNKMKGIKIIFFDIAETLISLDRDKISPKAEILYTNLKKRNNFSYCNW